MAAFFCHQQDDRLCSGWVGCHDMDNSLGLRFALAAGAITEDQFIEALDYQCSIPLFASGQEARDHGMAKLENPGDDAKRVAAKLTRKLGLD